MKKFWGLVILATIGFQVKAQDKSSGMFSHCQCVPGGRAGLSDFGGYQ
jgi:hypothetical protein